MCKYKYVKGSYVHNINSKGTRLILACEVHHITFILLSVSFILSSILLSLLLIYLAI